MILQLLIDFEVSSLSSRRALRCGLKADDSLLLWYAIHSDVHILSVIGSYLPLQQQ